MLAMASWRLASRAALRSTAPRHLARALSTKPFNLADIGEGIAEVEIMQWFVKPGDEVDQFDKLCEVQSDKATVEITSPFVGSIISLAYETGDTAKVGTPLLHWQAAGSTADPGAPVQPAVASPAGATTADPQTAPTAIPAVTTTGDSKVLATPATRHMAKEHNLDLSRIAGTGRDGRVTKTDVLSFLSNPPAAASTATLSNATQAAAASVAKPPPSAAKSATHLTPPPRATSTAALEDVSVPIKGIRKAMFAQMVEANKIPHFSYCDEVQMDALLEVRKQLKPLAEGYGFKFTLMPLLIKATSLALAEFPELNASVSDDGKQLIMKGAHNIGLAMDTPTGLLVPNVKDVRAKSLLEIAADLQRLQTDASAGKLGMGDLKGGTFSLSNIGNLGGTYTGPVINIPEVAIAGLGKARPSPRYDASGSLVKQTIMQVSWSADHRVIDGAMMARFSNAWIGYLERPATMLLHL